MQQSVNKPQKLMCMKRKKNRETHQMFLKPLHAVTNSNDTTNYKTHLKGKKAYAF